MRWARWAVRHALSGRATRAQALAGRRPSRSPSPRQRPGERVAATCSPSAQRANRSPEEPLARWADAPAQRLSVPRTLPWAARTGAPLGRSRRTSRKQFLAQRRFTNPARTGLSTTAISTRTRGPTKAAAASGCWPSDRVFGRGFRSIGPCRSRRPPPPGCVTWACEASDGPSGFGHK